MNKKDTLQEILESHLEPERVKQKLGELKPNETEVLEQFSPNNNLETPKLVKNPLPHFPITDPETYLDYYFPKKEREKIEILSIYNKGLEGKLDLRDFPNLKVLRCHINRLTDLDVSTNYKLRTIEAFRNKIQANISIFSHLTELEKLDLGVNSKGFSLNPSDPRFINNQFKGNLRSLEGCRALEELNIGYQYEIKEGLKFLPCKQLKNFECFGTIFQDWLKPFDYDVKAWKLFYYPEEVFQREYTFEELIDELARKRIESQQKLSLVKQNQNKLVKKGSLWTTKDWTPKIERLEQKIRLMEVKIGEIEEEKSKNREV